MKPWFAILIAALVGLPACSRLSIRSQSPETATEEKPAQTRLVGQWVSPYGLHTVQIEAVGMITGLPGTGSDPPPSYERSALINEMQARSVEQPNQVLSDPSTSAVHVRAFLRPGIQKGDRFDVEVTVPARNETQSLRGGWLMETRLRELANINSEIHTGDVWGLSTGAVLIDPLAAPDDRMGQTRGRILSGGVATKTRSLGLVLKPEHQSVAKSSRVGAAVNQRFFTYIDGAKRGVATPKNNEYIELRVHPRYKDNVARYIQVVQSIALRESPTERLERLKQLERQLLDPVTADTAALRLEAIGRDAAEVLKRGLASSDPLVRFYAAESLAYLDVDDAAAPLAEAARSEPAFRLFALTALSAMEGFEAFEGLASLLNLASAETRYGAFRALWAMNPNDALVAGEDLRGRFYFHVLRVEGPPMIHLTRSFRPEMVVFGDDIRLEPPFSLDAGPQILVAASGQRVTVSRFAVGQEDVRREVGLEIEEIVRAVVEVGGNYPDVVQFLHEAKQAGALGCRLEVDALPEAGRAYIAAAAGEDGGAGDGSSPRGGLTVSRPLPGLFPKWNQPGKGRGGALPSAEEAQSDDPLDETTDQKAARPRGPIGRAFGKIRG